MNMLNESDVLIRDYRLVTYHIVSFDWMMKKRILPKRLLLNHNVLRNKQMLLIIYYFIYSKSRKQMLTYMFCVVAVE